MRSPPRGHMRLAKSASLVFTTLFLLPSIAAAVPIPVDWTATASGPLGTGTLSGSFGVFGVVTGTETSLLPSAGLTGTVAGFATPGLDASYSQGGFGNLGNLAFEFTSLSSGSLIALGGGAPNDSCLTVGLGEA